MILTDYYRFERIATKSKLRMDCTASTRSYDPLEEKRATKANKATEKRDATNVGDLVIYFGDVPTHFGGDVHRKADKSITIKSENLSSVYVPDVRKNIGYGDFKRTSDALLFVFHGLKSPNGVLEAGAVIEIFVARGQRNNRVGLFNLLESGELDDEMEGLRVVTKLSENSPENDQNTLY